jgi:diguanylate cyclase (GGDEF)-like protein
MAVSGLWLTGWLLIDLHFLLSIFVPLPGWMGVVSSFMGISALAWGGMIFSWSCVPYRNQSSSPLMLGTLLGTITLYIGLLFVGQAGAWALTPAAALIGIAPLTVALLTVRQIAHPIRWMVIGVHCTLALFLLAVQDRPDHGIALALNAVFFAVYFSCSLHFWIVYRVSTTGALITIAGFFAWTAVFIASPAISMFLPQLHLEQEVWNLPKYVVAVGMILLLLEHQIEHNKFLALHDELTGLANRRLFEDRLTGALERARRTGTQAALMLVDLDHFKEVNDTVGHHVGDLLLKHVGAAFSGRVRRIDTVARTGGDEFSIILEGPTTREDAWSVGHSLMELLREPIEVGGHIVQTGASVGIAVFPQDASSTEALRIAADRRMYEDKNSSRRKDPRGSSQPTSSGSLQAGDEQKKLRA